MSSAMYRKRSTKLLLILTLLLLFPGCAKKTTVVLLADADGNVGKVTISNKTGTVQIDKAMEVSVVSGQQSAPTTPTVLSNEAIQADFATVLSISPEKPNYFLLYFKSESTKLTPKSKKLLPEILKTIENRNSFDINVVGHTDTAGDQNYNLRLSKRRATAVKRVLTQKGVTASYIKTTSHGEKNPLIQTADNVHEPRNRRVEVIVR